MKMTTLITGLLITFLGATAFSADCVSKAEMTEIASHFTQFSELAKKDFCFDGTQTSNLISAIMFMRKTPFAADMKKSSDELFSGRFASGWYNYYIGRINDITVQSSCPKGVAAYVMAFGGRTMYVCPALLTDNFSSLDRASVMMHEARHIDGFPHMMCSHGAREGIQGACDNKISDGGSYAVTVETYAQLAKYATDLNPALKAYARSSAVIYADEAFETPARVDRSSQLLVMSQSGELSGLTIGSNTLEPLGKSPALGHIVMRAQHMVLFPEDRTLPANFLFVNNAGLISQSAGDAAMEYNGMTPAQRADYVDLHIGAQWFAKIYKTKIAFSCSATANALSEITFPGVNAVGILDLNGYDRTLKIDYVMTDSGKLFEFGCTENSTSFLRPSNVVLDQKFKRVHKVDNTIIGLTNDGHLFKLENGKSTAIPTSIDGQIYEIAPRQTFNFFDATF
jgi:hypothetical protein